MSLLQYTRRYDRSNQRISLSFRIADIVVGRSHFRSRLSMLILHSLIQSYHDTLFSLVIKMKFGNLYDFLLYHVFSPAYTFNINIKSCELGNPGHMPIKVLIFNKYYLNGSYFLNEISNMILRRYFNDLGLCFIRILK